MIHYKYISDNINLIVDKKNTIKVLLDKFTTNHSDYLYNLDINILDNKYTLEAKLIRP